MTEISLKNPFLIIALTLAVTVIGLFSYFKSPADLFPDTSPPQVLILTVEPGASAEDISDKITQVIEKETSTISGLKRIRATSRDEVSALTAEFHYTKDINEAVTDVIDALERIKAQLPGDILPPRIYKITDSTHATMTIALSPKKGSSKTLSGIRLLAENDIKDEILQIPQVGDVDIFGGYLPEVKILVDRDKMKGYGITLTKVIAALRSRNVTIPGGYIYTKNKEYLLRSTSEFKNLDDIRNLPIKKTKNGYILVKDIGIVKQGIKERRSLYHGNGHPAIAMNNLRSEKGYTHSTIRAFKRYLPKLKKEYPDIKFQVTNDQEPIININLKGMRSSLNQAIIMTVLIIFLFLADRKSALIISISIPLSFLFSFMVLKFTPYTLNMVTLSGLIISVGMVVDASIVVLENIYRHFQQDKALSPYQASLSGTQEVALANTVGAFTTIIVLIPIMFTGGYPQKVLRQLSVMIGSTIFASLLISLTVIPLVASKLLNRKGEKKSVLEQYLGKFDSVVKAITRFYLSLLKVALKFKALTLLLVLIAFILTLKIVPPLVTGELMPPMDAGISRITIDMPSSYNINRVEKIVYQVESFIKKTAGYVSMSSVVGSEPGEISFGGGGATTQQANITVNLLTRDKRKQTIWEIQDKWRNKLRAIEGIRSFSVMELGATPLSTTKAPFDLILRSKNTKLLNIMANRVLAKFRKVRGLIDLRRSWYMDKPEVEIVPDAKLCKYYGVTTQTVAQYIKSAVKGNFASFMRLKDFIDIPINIEYKEKNLNEVSKLNDIYLPTKYGQIPLRNLVKVKTKYIQPFITREDLQNTIDITGVNKVYTIAQVAKGAGKMMEKNKVVLPKGFDVRMSGIPANMLDARTRMGKALIYGLVLMYILLMSSYKSFSVPIVIMATIPLAVIGAFWGLLIFDKPLCLPAFMGMILLAGVIIKNAVLLLDFIIAARGRGVTRGEAIIQSVEIRTRPILMTAATTVIGLIPLMFSMAVGLERLAPLGIVAGVGLILGTFLTIIVIPVIYCAIDDLTTKISFKKETIKGLIIFLALSSLMFPHLVFAQQGKGIFSLKSAIAYALKNSPDIKKSIADIEKARGGKLKIRAGLLPQINLNSTYTNYQEEHPIVPGILGKKERFDNNVISNQAQASLLITDFGKSFYVFKSTKEKYLAAIKNLERRKEVVIYTVSNIYFNINSLDKLIVSLETMHKTTSELQRRIKLYLKEGKVAKIDLLKINVRLAEIEDEIAQLESKRIYLLGLLAEEMGYKKKLKISKNMKLFAVDVNKLSVTSALNAALQNREDLAGYRNLVKSSYFGLKSSKRAYLPEIKAFGGVGEFSGTSSDAKFSGDNRWEDNYWCGVKVSFPIFDSGLRKGNILKAKGEYSSRKAEETKILLGIYKDVRKSLADIIFSQKRLNLASASQREAKEALRLEQLKYKEGKGVINDVLDAEVALRRSDYLYYSAISDYNTGIFESYLAEGLLLENYDSLISKEKTCAGKKNPE